MACENYHLKSFLWRLVRSKYLIIWVIFVYNADDDFNGDMQKCPINMYLRLNGSKWHSLLPISIKVFLAPFLDSPRKIFYNNG